MWGGSARVQGIGERLERAPLLPGGWLVVCKPPVGVNTKEAYRLADAQGGSSASRHAAKVMEALSRGNLAEVGASLGNAFEDILQLPEVETIKAGMRRVRCARGLHDRERLGGLWAVRSGRTGSSM